MRFEKNSRTRTWYTNGNIDDLNAFRENSSQEIYKVQDVVKKKTKAVENYRPSRHCRIGFKSKVSDVFSSYLLRYLVDKYFMYFV